MTFIGASTVKQALYYAQMFGMTDVYVISSAKDIDNITSEDDVLYVNDDEAMHDPYVVKAVKRVELAGITVDWFGGVPYEFDTPTNA